MWVYDQERQFSNLPWSKSEKKKNFTKFLPETALERIINPRRYLKTSKWPFGCYEKLQNGKINHEKECDASDTDGLGFDDTNAHEDEVESDDEIKSEDLDIGDSEEINDREIENIRDEFSVIIPLSGSKSKLQNDKKKIFKEDIIWYHFTKKLSKTNKEIKTKLKPISCNYCGRIFKLDLKQKHDLFYRLVQSHMFGRHIDKFSEQQK